MVDIADPRGFKSKREKQAEEAPEKEPIEPTYEEEPAFDENQSRACIIIIDRIPKVDEKKLEKLISTLRKKVLTNGGKLVIRDLDVPMVDGLTAGYALVEYETAEMAAVALEKLNGFKLDDKHTFVVNSMLDYERLAAMSDAYQEPSEAEIRENMPRGMGDNLKWWACDALGRDQFVIKHGENVAVKWNDSLAPPQTVFEQRGWTQPTAARTYRGLPEVEWSPRGSYLAVFAEPVGDSASVVELWGSEHNVCIRAFAHPGVVQLTFSPCERYLITFAPNERSDPALEGTIFWDVATGRKLDSIPDSTAAFVFSADDRFVCCGTEHGIFVYETAALNLKKPKKITVRDMGFFSMSPSSPILAAWVPEVGHSPARVVVIDIESAREVRQKNLVSVVEIAMYWQKCGDFLCVRVNRATKTGKTIFVNLELFRLRERDIPVETLKLDDRVLYVAWEPVGRRLAVVHSANPESTTPDVSLYTMGPAKVELLKTLEAKKTNALFWAPRGKFLIIAGLQPLSGRLEFWNVAELKMMATDDHFQINGVEWDPSGRYLASFVCRNNLEHGYKIWSFAGKLLHEESLDHFHLFRWRPRPPTVLTPAQTKELQRTLPIKAQEYERIDYLRAQELDSETRTQRRAMHAEFAGLRAGWQAQRAAVAAARLARFGPPKERLVQREAEVETLLEEIRLTEE